MIEFRMRMSGMAKRARASARVGVVGKRSHFENGIESEIESVSFVS